ncbi:MAG: regulator of chromosome condensation [Gemmatimonadetes bacterium]|nr:regulator of chromosome condensation [Gemmatimonadota bacterium]
MSTRLAASRARAACLAAACVALALFTLQACTSELAPPSAYVVTLDEIGSSGWRDVSVGREFTCALDVDARAWCWGRNAEGQLGHPAARDSTCGTELNAFPCARRPVPVETTLRFRTLSTGATHACGITVNAALVCWGSNGSGQLGATGFQKAELPITIALPISAVSAGATHTCALTLSSVLLCFGSNSRGELGDGTVTPSATPVFVRLATSFIAVSAGEQRTCALASRGTAFCWGAIWTERQQDFEFTRSALLPEEVPGGNVFTSISVSTYTTCARDAGSALWCWEANPYGELGDGTTEGKRAPTRVASQEPFTGVSAGVIQTCAGSSSGGAFCWGSDAFGQLGVFGNALGERCGPQEIACATRPLRIPGRAQFTQASTGLGNHACAITSRSNLFCWGLGSSGQRGDGRSADVIAVPTQVVRPAPL